MTVDNSQQGYFGIFNEDLSIMTDPRTMRMGSQPKIQPTQMSSALIPVKTDTSTVSEAIRLMHDSIRDLV